MVYFMHRIVLVDIDMGEELWEMFREIADNHDFLFRFKQFIILIFYIIFSVILNF